MFNYYKVAETGDLRYLLRLDNYEALPTYNIKKLLGVWQAIQYKVSDLHCKLNRKNALIFDKQKEVAALKFKLFRVQSCVFLLKIKKDEAIQKELGKLGYPINTKKDYAEELERISRVCRGIETQFGIVENELKALTSTGDSVDIIAMKQNIEEYYKMSVPINMNTFSIKEWLYKQYGAINKTA